MREKKLKRKRINLRDLEAELDPSELEEFSAPFVVEGYVGKAKGSRMHVFVRGHWTNGLTHDQCCAILDSQPDFKMETSRLEKFWLRQGHGATKTTKSTPESVEIEYDWGKGKYEFRNHINTKSTSLSVYRAGVLRSLGRHSYISRTGHLRPPPLPRKRHWRFIRRANDYMRAYILFESPRAVSVKADEHNCSLFALIENARRTVKSHRCTGERQYTFTTTDDANDQTTPEDDRLCCTYLSSIRPVVDMYTQVDDYLRSLES